MSHWAGFVALTKGKRNKVLKKNLQINLLKKVIVYLKDILQRGISGESFSVSGKNN